MRVAWIFMILLVIIIYNRIIEVAKDTLQLLPAESKAFVK